MTIVAIMAGFAFGYSVTDIILNIRANRRIDQFVKDLELKD